MSNRVWILGASDPEMEAIEALLRECGERVVYALGPDGERVTSREMYRARLSTPATAGVAYEVECMVADRATILSERCITIDHHRPGDPGYGRPPAEFLPASSIGQVVAVLARLDLLRDWARSSFMSSNPPGTIHVDHHRGDMVQPHCAIVATAQPYEGWAGQHAVREIPDDIVFAAAADHCLGAAYRGECPGVHPDALMQWRVESRAKFQGVAPKTILAAIEAARGELAAAPTLRETTRDDVRRAVEGWEYDRMANGRLPDVETWTSARDAHLQSICPDAMDDVRDMRRPEPIPELPEAATRDGVAYVSGPLVDPRDPGRAKYTVSGPADVVRAWMETWAPAQGMVGIYGDPARGFAGGGYM